LPHDAEPPAGVEHGQAVADVELTRPQMLNNLLGRLPFLGHDPDLPRCGPGEQSPWTEFARASHPCNTTAIRPFCSVRKEVPYKFNDLRKIGAEGGIVSEGVAQVFDDVGNPHTHYEV